MTTLIIYHANCPDGFCSAWVATKKYPGAELFAANYGESPPMLQASGRDVVIVDFSYPRGPLESLHAVAKDLKVFDHHKTAEAALAGLPYCKFDMNRSGAGLTWDELFPGVTRPWVVDYVEDRDLWRFKLMESRAVNAFISSYPKTIDAWDGLDQVELSSAMRAGAAIVRYQDQLIETMMERAGMTAIGGYVVPCTNATALWSDVANELLHRHLDAPFAAAYYVRPDGTRVFSLRSDSGRVDVSEIAKKYGGGGHRNAAGFQLAESAKL